LEFSPRRRGRVSNIYVIKLRAPFGLLGACCVSFVVKSNTRSSPWTRAYRHTLHFRLFLPTLCSLRLKNSSPYDRGRDESSPYMTSVLFVPNFPFFFRCGSARRGHADRFGATVKEINSLMRLTSFKRRKQARRSLICLSGSSGAASGRNLRSCSASVINRLKWPRW
jgi:hypothetical protein